MIRIERLRFRQIWSMMTRSIHECWHVRTNKCVRINICKTSVFVVRKKHKHLWKNSHSVHRFTSNEHRSRKSALCSGILFASPKVFHRPRFDYPLHFNIRNIVRTVKSYDLTVLTRSQGHQFEPGQRSGMATGGKRRALVYFPVRICYMLVRTVNRASSKATKLFLRK